MSSLRSPILMTRQSFLFLMVMMALLLKMMVLLRFRGRDSLENTRPTMKACTMQPRTAWRLTRIMASVHLVVVCLVP